jgi:hypothetical protein
MSRHGVPEEMVLTNVNEDAAALTALIGLATYSPDIWLTVNAESAKLFCLEKCKESNPAKIWLFFCVVAGLKN